MRSEKYNKPSKVKKPNTKLGKFTKFWAVLYLLVLSAFVAMLIHFNLLPAKYLLIGLGTLSVISILILVTLWFKVFKKSRKIIALVLSIILMIVYGLGISYMTGTLNFFSKVTAVSVQTEDYYVLVKADSTYKEIDEIKGKTVQTYMTNEVNYSEAKSQLKEKENVEYEMIESLSDLADGLQDETYEIVFVSEAHYNTICDEHETFADDTKILYTVKIEIKAEDISKDVDVTSESFNILVSGLDISGSINSTSRSDVNMIVTINPKTHTVLLTSLPRDLAIELPSKNNATDKLTHTGIYGINETVGAVENLMGIDINYYVKVNYTTITEFVDAIDGVDVNSDYTFVTSGMGDQGLNGYVFYEGDNHLTGNEALAFARERHSFSDGDVQRNKNQQKIIEAMIKKATTSTTLLTRYTSILSAIEDYIEINMTTDDIQKLVKMQLEEMPSWTIESQNLTGIGDTTTCYSTGDYLVYVMTADEASLIKAVDNITAIKAGNGMVEDNVND